MAGFFDFGTDTPALGAGKCDELDAELPDDEDIDLVNDETFGSGAEFGGNWEEQHQKLAVQLENFKCEFEEDSLRQRTPLKGDSHGSLYSDGTNNHGRYQDDELGDSGYHAADKYRSQEEDLEQSLSQLVVDDDDIDDPAIMNLSKQRPIPQTRNNNLDNLFGPSSPPGFLNTEHLVSPGKTNIWGSPVTRENYLQPTPPQDDGGIKKLLTMLQAKPAAEQVPLQDPSIVMAGKSTTMPNMRNSHPITVEELERDMRGQPIPDNQGGISTAHHPAPIGTPPRGQYIQQHIQRIPPGNKMSSSPGQMFGTSPHAPGYGHTTTPITIAKRVATPPGFHQPGLDSQSQSLLTLHAMLRRNSSPTLGLVESPSPPVYPRQVRTPTPPLPSAMVPKAVQHVPGCSSPLCLLSPDELKSRLITSMATKVLPKLIASGMLQGSPTDRHSGPPGQADRPMPPFLSNTPVQQRMPFPGSFTDPIHMRGRGPHLHQGPPPRQALFNHNKPGFEPRFPGDRFPPERFQNGRHPGERFPPGDRFHGDRFPHNDRFPNDDHHLRFPNDYHMDRGRGYNNHMERGRGFGGRGGRGFDPHMDHGGHGGYDMRGRGGFDMRGRGGFEMRGRGRGPYHYNYRWRQNSIGEEEEEERGDRDEYANLMTQKERDWIIKIQLMQLHTNNPYLDDYYYTRWQMEKLVRERAAKAGSKGEPKLVLPQLAKGDARMYRPVQFEGSLGRLTASSVHNPRQIIDVKVKTTTGEEEGRHKEVRRFKELLIDIEKSYDLLLDIDDMEKKALALPEDARPPLYRARAEKIEELFIRLHLAGNHDVTFLQLITIRKGIKLIARTLPFLSKNQAMDVVHAILIHLPAVLKRDMQDEVLAQLFEAVSRVIHVADLATLVSLAGLLQNSGLDNQNSAIMLTNILHSKFGASILWSVVSRAEAIFRNTSPVDMDVSHQNAWSTFIHTLGGTIVEMTDMAQPFYIFPTVPPYMQLVLDIGTYTLIETRLSEVLTPSTPTPDAKPSTPSLAPSSAQLAS